MVSERTFGNALSCNRKNTKYMFIVATMAIMPVGATALPVQRAGFDLIYADTDAEFLPGVFLFMLNGTDTINVLQLSNKLE